MATTRVTWFGVIVEFDNTEINQITSNINVGAAGAGTVVTMLAALGINGPAAVVIGIANALFTLGAAALGRCNSTQRGIVLYVLWVGVPWCRAR
ncbi:MAG TPA: hypothetical protein VMF86_09215 [Stellaceae bacterium]|nr:hypothetical protein [Stellaceae bacterium]